MADEGQHEDVPRERGIVLRLPLIAKFIEIIIAIFAIGLIVDPMNSFQRIFNKPRFKLDDAAIIYVTNAGYIIINTLFIISHLLGDRIPKRTLVLFASVGAMLHIVAGSVMVYNWKKMSEPYYHNNEIYPSKLYMEMFISGAVFTFINAIAFIVEVFFIVKYSSKTTS